jgi:hypothetical protein
LAIDAVAVLVDAVDGEELAVSVEQAASERAPMAASPAEAAAVLYRMCRIVTPCVLVTAPAVGLSVDGYSVRAGTRMGLADRVGK